MALLAVTPIPAEPQLLQVAQLITKVDQWQEGQLTVGDYLWWSPKQILIFYGDKGERLVDIETKRSIPFVANQTRGHQWNLSPDRTMLVEQSWKGRTITWRITDPAGKHEFGSWSSENQDPQPGLGEDRGYWAPTAVWAHDGRSLYQIAFDPKAPRGWNISQRSLADLNKPRIFPKAPFGEYYSTLEIYDGRALHTQYYRADETAFLIKEWDLAAPLQTKRYWNVRAPSGQVIISYQPSPDYHAALWVMGRPNQKPLSNGGYPYYAVSLWTSGLHGEHLTEIGVIDFHTMDTDRLMDHYQHFGGILWNPDGQHVSFIYDRKLYWVNATIENKRVTQSPSRTSESR